MKLSLARLSLLALLVATTSVACAASSDDDPLAATDDALTSSLKLDPGFATKGRFLGDFGRQDDLPVASTQTALPMDGSGDLYFRSGDETVVRLSPNGAVKATIDHAPFIGESASWFGLALLGADRLVLAGVSGSDPRKIALAMPRRDGSPAAAGGPPASAIVQLGTFVYPEDRVIARTAADGSVYVAGSAQTKTPTKPSDLYSPFVVRVKTDGSTAIVTPPVVTEPELDVEDFVVQPDGRFLLLGTRPSDGYVDVLARRQANGAIDPGFGASGYVRIDAPNPVHAAKVAVDPAGRILVAGWMTTTPNPASTRQPIVLRLKPDGTPDASFGNGGRVEVAAAAAAGLVNGTDGLGNASFDDILPTATGMVAVGSIQTSNTGTKPRSALLVARLTTTGALDPTFDGDGVAFGQIERAFDVSAAVLTPTGLVVGGVMGTRDPAPNQSHSSRIAVAKLRL